MVIELILNKLKKETVYIHNLKKETLTVEVRVLN